MHMLIAIIIGALAGGAVFGLPGALLGGVLGFWAAQLIAMTLMKGALGTIRAQFLDSTFAVMGALCKADGQVTRDEIRVADGDRGWPAEADHPCGDPELERLERWPGHGRRDGGQRREG